MKQAIEARCPLCGRHRRLSSTPLWRGARKGAGGQNEPPEKPSKALNQGMLFRQNRIQSMHQGAFLNEVRLQDFAGVRFAEFIQIIFIGIMQGLYKDGSQVMTMKMIQVISPYPSLYLYLHRYPYYFFQAS